MTEDWYDDGYECAGCQGVFDGEPAYVGVPHPDDGLPDVFCHPCWDRICAEQAALDARMTELEREYADA